MRDELSAGLAKVDALKPGQGYAELLAGARGEGASVVGFVHGELGARLSERASVFAFAEAMMRPSFTPEWMAGLGARVTW